MEKENRIMKDSHISEMLITTKRVFKQFLHAEVCFFLVMPPYPITYSHFNFFEDNRKTSVCIIILIFKLLTFILSIKLDSQRQIKVNLCFKSLYFMLLKFKITYRRYILKK